MWSKVLISCLLLTGCATSKQSSETGTQQLSSDQFASVISNSYRSAFPGVSQAEALERMMIMSESQSVSVCARQQEGYAGFVIVHSPDFEIRAYFKGDAARKLSQCTDDPNYKAIETPYSIADLEPKKAIVETALRAANIEFSTVLVPFGHLDNHTKPYGDDFITTDGHVLVSVAKDDVSRAQAVVAPLGLQKVYVREEVIDEIVVT